MLLTLFILFLIGAAIAFLRWDYLDAEKRRKAFAEKQPELLDIVRAHVENETREQLVDRVVGIAAALPQRQLEIACKRILDNPTKNN